VCWSEQYAGYHDKGRSQSPTQSNQRDKGGIIRLCAEADFNIVKTKFEIKKIHIASERDAAEECYKKRRYRRRKDEDPS